MLVADADASSALQQGDVATNDVAEPGTVFSDANSGDQTEVDAATQSAVDRGAFAYSAHGEVSAEVYAGVLRPYRTVAVAGAGTRLSGQYLISEVTHNLRDRAYSQTFTLRRNAYSAAGGGLPGGIF